MNADAVRTRILGAKHELTIGMVVRSSQTFKLKVRAPLIWHQRRISSDYAAAADTVFLTAGIAHLMISGRLHARARISQ